MSDLRKFASESTHGLVRVRNHDGMQRKRICCVMRTTRCWLGVRDRGLTFGLNLCGSALTPTGLLLPITSHSRLCTFARLTSTLPSKWTWPPCDTRALPACAWDPAPSPENDALICAIPAVCVDVLVLTSIFCFVRTGAHPSPQILVL